MKKRTKINCQKNEECTLEILLAGSFCPPAPPYGKERRQLIIHWFLQNPRGVLYVNCAHRPQLKEDSDLKKLIKKKFLIVNKSKESCTFKRTYLTCSNIN